MLIANFAYAGSHECEAACTFAEDATGEPCEDVAGVLEEIYGACGEDEGCWVNATVEASEGAWSEDDASGFLEQLFSYDCDF